MRAGFTALPPIASMRTRLTLEGPVETPDGQGGVTRSFAPVATLWGAVEPSGGGEGFDADRQDQLATHRITLRWRAGVTAAMRFTTAGGRVFGIRLASDPDGRRSRLVCKVEELTP